MSRKFSIEEIHGIQRVCNCFAGCRCSFPKKNLGECREVGYSDIIPELTIWQAEYQAVVYEDGNLFWIPRKIPTHCSG